MWVCAIVPALYTYFTLSLIDVKNVMFFFPASTPLAMSTYSISLFVRHVLFSRLFYDDLNGYTINVVRYCRAHFSILFNSFVNLQLIKTIDFKSDKLCDERIKMGT